MNRNLTHENPLFRDFISSYLIELVSETRLNTPILLMRRLSAFELMQKFSDAKDFLGQKLPSGKRYIGATISSHVDLDSHSSLASLSTDRSFKWELYNGKN
jgi:hypothetical protein